MAIRAKLTAQFYLAALLLPGCPPDQAPRWSVARVGTTLQLAYGDRGHAPQFAVVHLESGYFRMVYGPGSGWGTSVVLVPSFWTGGVLRQGTPVEAAWEIRGGTLWLELQGSLAGLAIRVELRLSPPEGDSVRAAVRVTTSGTVQLDPRPGEAFKLVMLSSMNIAADQWDAATAFVDEQTLPIPAAEWLTNPPVRASRFGLHGGTSRWKRNAPTVEIRLDEPRAITGWVTPSSDPNDDNVAFWAAGDHLERAWRYTIVARP